MFRPKKGLICKHTNHFRNDLKILSFIRPGMKVPNTVTSNCRDPTTSNCVHEIHLMELPRLHPGYGQPSLLSCPHPTIRIEKVMNHTSTVQPCSPRVPHQSQLQRRLKAPQPLPSLEITTLSIQGDLMESYPEQYQI